MYMGFRQANLWHVNVSTSHSSSSVETLGILVVGDLLELKSEKF